MRKIYLLLFLLQFFIRPFAEAQFFGNTRMAVDNMKNYSLFSGFQNSVRFNDSTIYASSSYYPWKKQFFAKCDSDMNLSWYTVIYGTPFWGNRDIQLATDRRGNTYFACLHNSFRWIGDTVLVFNESGGDSARLLLVKYDKSGRVLWYRMSSVVAFTDSKIGLGVDSNNDVFVCYDFYPSVTFGGDTLRETLTYTGTYVVKFDSAGNEQWLTGLSGGKNNYDFCVSQAGVAHIGGSASALQGFGPITFTVPGGPAPSLSVCNAEGAPYWQANFTSTGNTHTSVSVGSNERPVVVGKYYDSVGFTAFPSFSTVDSASYLASYNTDGTERWAKRGDGLDLTDVRVTFVNDIFVVGNITDPVVAIDTFHLAVSGAQGCVVHLDSNGNYICNFNFSNFSLEASSIGPEDEFIICGRASIMYSSMYPHMIPVFAGDTMYAASDACLYILSIGGSCELKGIDSLTNFYLPEEKVLEQSIKSSINVSPNPVESKLNVEINGQIPSDGVLAIRDLEGRVLFSDVIKGRNVKLDVGSLSPGVYMLEYTNGIERVVEKFVKR